MLYPDSIEIDELKYPIRVRVAVPARLRGRLAAVAARSVADRRLRTEGSTGDDRLYLRRPRESGTRRPGRRRRRRRRTGGRSTATETESTSRWPRRWRSLRASELCRARAVVGATGSPPHAIPRPSPKTFVRAGYRTTGPATSTASLLTEASTRESGWLVVDERGNAGKTRAQLSAEEKDSRDFEAWAVLDSNQ